ncbi:alpha/beta fold hydrolase [Pseudomarimonas arenosa]|uniref:Alpha/beta fold hydrolase n=1 Tax=Pseudomarimonas arenosa TaxID=2774145 RepID=A0AAW3ZLT9_9GAMM|nr:alpha/beta hydrolase [Pseudomarimonas arenosa]MBD8525386.1 alpha/beta fold hydrolase [Pseudomarimonas arenosa]
MPRATVGTIELDYACFGPEDGPPLLLIMGLSMQRTAWPESLLHALVEHGLRVITFDNRDIGLSTRFHGVPAPSMLRVAAARLARRSPQLPYSLADLADDAAGLLTHLAIEQAHVVGISMGGMIAQHMALRHPQRLGSLSLLASSSGRIGLPLPRLAVLRLMNTRPVGGDEAAAVDYIDRLFSVLAGPGWPSSPETRRMRALDGVRRAPTGRSSERQLAAILADGRAHRLKEISAPTLVLHGTADPMLPPAHGRDLAKRIHGARYIEIPGWGHDLPDGLMPEMAAKLAEHVRKALPNAGRPSFQRSV